MATNNFIENRVEDLEAQVLELSKALCKLTENVSELTSQNLRLVKMLKIRGVL